MPGKNQTASGLTPKSFLDTMIILSLIGVLGYFCIAVISPFMPVIVWGLMLAVMLYPLQQGLARRLNGRQGASATIITVCAVLMIVGPVAVLGTSFATQIVEWNQQFENHELSISQPDPGVAEWPLVGERLYGAWSQAATNFPEFLASHRDEIKTFAAALVRNAKSILGMVLVLVGGLIVAGIMMAWGDSGSNALLRIFNRVSGAEAGASNQKLAVATIRSVVAGVVGVAFIQALIFGIGLLLAGIPAAGVIAMIVLMIAIIQMPTLLVAIPVIIYLWSGSDGSVAGNVFFTVLFLAAGLADNVLKPLLLGRGVDAPMPVILIGALGGMVVSGFIGLFTGAVILTLGYKLFMGWVAEGNGGTGETVRATGESDTTVQI
jgi:predicted PurR-regulated permease PerM